MTQRCVAREWEFAGPCALTTGTKCLASVRTKPKQLRPATIRCVNLRSSYWGYNLDTRALRNTLGQFATGVCILTTQTSDHRSIGMTVNSFAAVSLDPALVLWSIQNTSECFKEFTECERYGISILKGSQQALSDRYARSLAHEMDVADTIVNDAGVPLVKDALATLSCRLTALHQGGDHHIIVGEVEALTHSEGEPLVFFSGGYQRLA